MQRHHHAAPPKRHPQRRDMRAQAGHRRDELAAAPALAELRVEEVALMAEGKAKMLPGLHDAVEFAAGLIIAQPVATVVGEPQLTRTRLKIKAD